MSSLNGQYPLDGTANGKGSNQLVVIGTVYDAVTLTSTVAVVGGTGTWSGAHGSGTYTPLRNPIADTNPVSQRFSWKRYFQRLECEEGDGRWLEEEMIFIHFLGNRVRQWGFSTLSFHIFESAHFLWNKILKTYSFFCWNLFPIKIYQIWGYLVWRTLSSLLSFLSPWPTFPANTSKMSSRRKSLKESCGGLEGGSLHGDHDTEVHFVPKLALHQNLAKNSCISKFALSPIRPLLIFAKKVCTP